MCEPLTIAAITLTIASTGYQLYQQRENAQAQEAYQNQMHEYNSDIANANATSQYLALGERRLQEQEAAAQAIDKVTREAQEARGSAKVAAGEAGVNGLSVDALMSEFSRQELQFQSNIIRSESFADSQFARDAESVRAQQAGQIFSTLPQPVPQPDYIGAALSTAGSLVSFAQARGGAQNTGGNAGAQGRVIQ